MNFKTISFILIIIGIMMVAYTGFDFMSSDSMRDMGMHQMHGNGHGHLNDNHFLAWPPIIGIILIASGVLNLIFRKRPQATT